MPSRRFAKRKATRRKIRRYTKKRQTRKQRGGSWKIPSYSTVIWRDRRDDPYSPPIVTSKEVQQEMSEYD